MNEVLIAAVVQRIVETAHPEKVVIFGSRARGDARPDSDLDVLVIKDSNEPRYRRSVPLYVALADVPVEVEVMVYTPEEIEEWSQVPQAFVTPPCARALPFIRGPADLSRGLLRKVASDMVTLDAALGAGAFDAVCFHAQQAAEKCLKAFLAHCSVPFPYTHNLTKLVEMCVQ